MPFAFDLIGEDFRRELRTIRDLLDLTFGGSFVGSSAVPVRIATSNACILLLGASYEEFVREIVREYAAALIAGAPPFTAFPDEFIAAVWDRMLFLLRGSRFGRSDFDPTSARNSLAQLQTFCLDGDRSAARADAVAYNENNLRPKELNIIFKRVGLRDYCSVVGNQSDMVNFFGSPDGPSAHGQMINFLNEFYDTRNEVAHSIGSRKFSGVSNLIRYLDFFECFASATIADLMERTAA